LEAARDVAETTCKASMTVTEIETAETYYRGEAEKLSEYEVLMPSIKKVKRKVTAKNQADAIYRGNNGEGEVLSESNGAGQFRAPAIDPPSFDPFPLTSVLSDVVNRVPCD